MRSYENARGLFSFLEFLAWGGVLLGIAIIFVSMEAASRNFGGGAGLLAAMPGIAISLFSLIWVAIIQVARAGVDTAELTQQTLKVARDQLEVSKQSLKQGAALQNSFADLVRKEPTPPDTRSLEHENGKASYAKAADPKPPKTVTVEHQNTPVVLGHTLTYQDQSAKLIDGKWHHNGIAFESQEKVVEYIETNGVQAKQSPALRAER